MAFKFHEESYKPKVADVNSERAASLRGKYLDIIDRNEQRLKAGDNASVFRILKRTLATEGPGLGESPENWIDKLVEKGALKETLKYEALDALGVKSMVDIAPAELDRRLLAAIERKKSSWGKAQMAEALKIYELHQKSPLAHPLQVMDWIDEQVKNGHIPAEESGSYSDIADTLIWEATHT